jgi:presenilin-like A22 family membrane protease
MVACCAHHLTDVLPLVGLAGAAFFLAAYQWLFLLLGVLSNLVGLVFMLGQLRKHRLHPARPSLLSLTLAWPADRAVPYVLAASAAVFGIAAALAIG